MNVSWIDVLKPDEHGSRSVRSRFVANETRRVSGPMDHSVVFCAKPPLEVFRAMGSLMMSLPGATLAADAASDICWRFLEISRAHPNCEMRRVVYTALPREYSKGRCGLLMKTLYGVRDAGANFEAAVTDLLISGGAVRGSTNPC